MLLPWSELVGFNVCVVRRSARNRLEVTKTFVLPLPSHPLLGALLVLILRHVDPRLA